MADVQAVAIITHGDLMTLAGAYSYEIVLASEISVVHDQAMSATAGYHIGRRWLPGFEIFRGDILVAGGTDAASIYGTTWRADTITGAGAFALAAASYTATYLVIDQTLLEQDAGHIAVHRFGLIKVFGIVHYLGAAVVDFGHWQSSAAGKITGLGGILCASLTFFYRAHGRNHVRDALFRHTTQVVTLAGISAHEETQDLHTNVGRSEPHAIALWIAFLECSCSSTGTCGCGSVEWWTVVDCAP